MSVYKNTPPPLVDSSVLNIVKRYMAPEKVAGYIILIDPDSGTYQGINGHTGATDFGGPSNAGGIWGNDVGQLLQACLKAAPGKKVFIKNGVYYAITCISGVNQADLIIEGEEMGAFDNFKEGTTLIFNGSAGKVFIDGLGCRNVTLRNIKIKNQSSVSNLIGVRVGDNTNSANKTKCSSWLDVVIDSFPNGLQGATYGPDDSTFINCYFGNSSIVAVNNLSSQCKFLGGTFYSSAIGYQFGRAAGASAADSGAEFYGTVFSGCAVPFEIIGGQNMNVLYCAGVWVENANTMILRVTNASTGIYIGSIIFMDAR